MKKHVKSFFAKIFQKKWKKSRKIFFTSKNQLSGQLGSKNSFQLSGHCPDSCFFFDFWNQIWKKWNFLQKNKIKWKNEDSVLWEVWRIMFSIFQTKNIHLYMFFELYFQILKTRFLDNCPDSCQNSGPKVLLVQRLHHYKVHIVSYKLVLTMFSVPFDLRNTFQLFLKAFKAFKFNFLSKYIIQDP